MLRVSRSDASIGIVGIKQLFPYTNMIYHTGIVFAPDGMPAAPVSAPRCVAAACQQAARIPGGHRRLPADRASAVRRVRGLRRGLSSTATRTSTSAWQVRQRGRKIVCCTSAFIYHYGQISEGRTADDDRNAALFASKWSGAGPSGSGRVPGPRSGCDRSRQPRPAPPASRRWPTTASTWRTISTRAARSPGSTPSSRWR